MGRWLVGAAGMLFGTGLFAASATSVAAGGGWLPTLGAFALGGLLGAFFGNSGFTVAFVLTVVAVVATVVMRLLAKPESEAVAPPVFAGLGNQIAAAAPPSKAGAAQSHWTLDNGQRQSPELRVEPLVQA